MEIEEDTVILDLCQFAIVQPVLPDLSSNLKSSWLKYLFIPHTHFSSHGVDIVVPRTSNICKDETFDPACDSHV